MLLSERRGSGHGGDGGRAKTREAKLATFHTTERRDRKNGLRRRDEDSLRVSAAIESAASCGADPQPRRSGRIEIVDLWYAKEHAPKCPTPLHALLTIVIW